MINSLKIQEKLYSFLKLFDKQILLNCFQNIKSGQSQKHGFDFENEIRTKVFNLNPQINDKNIHDIPAKDNKFNNNENISIKITQNLIEFGDILRFFDYDFNQQNTIIVGKYTQIGEIKKINEIIEIDYNQELHTYLFGTVTKEIIKNYIKMVKAIPKGKVKFKSYLNKKKEIMKDYSMNICINPKVDSQNQRRVQCSIKKIPDNFIITRSYDSVRGIKINTILQSGRRKFN